MAAIFTKVILLPLRILRATFLIISYWLMFSPWLLVQVILDPAVEKRRDDLINTERPQDFAEFYRGYARD